VAPGDIAAVTLVRPKAESPIASRLASSTILAKSPCHGSGSGATGAISSSATVVAARIGGILRFGKQSAMSSDRTGAAPENAAWRITAAGKAADFVLLRNAIVSVSRICPSIEKKSSRRLTGGSAPSRASLKRDWVKSKKLPWGVPTQSA
jgi:hypothetical protein